MNKTSKAETGEGDAPRVSDPTGLQIENAILDSKYELRDVYWCGGEDVTEKIESFITQRDELLAALKGALAAISQPVSFTRERSDREHVRAYKILSQDCETARQWLQTAIAKAEGMAQ